MNETTTAPVAMAGDPVPRAVLDTNVVLDWLVFKDARAAALAAAIAEGALRWLSCAPMRDELAHMLASSRLARWAPDAAAVLAVHDRLATTCPAPGPASATRPRCTDPDDQVFVDLALAGGARWLLTHDRALLRLKRRVARDGLLVLRPQDWPGAEPARP